MFLMDWGDARYPIRTRSARPMAFNVNLSPIGHPGVARRSVTHLTALVLRVDLPWDGEQLRPCPWVEMSLPADTP